MGPHVFRSFCDVLSRLGTGPGPGEEFNAGPSAIEGPAITGISTKWKNFGGLFRKFRFTGIAEHIGIRLEPPRPEPAGPKTANQMKLSTLCAAQLTVKSRHLRGTQAASKAPPATIVVPCYNEELVLPYVANTLRSVATRPGARIRPAVHFRGRRQHRWHSRQLKKRSGGGATAFSSGTPRNLGVAASILTGIRHSTTETVCSMDCDCTYDPHELQKMIPLLEDGVDMVTASPYHPQGKVLNVPAWRLFLSETSSALYSWFCGGTCTPIRVVSGCTGAVR